MQRPKLCACPAGDSLWSPIGGASILQGAKPVRLAAGAFLLCVQKEPKYGQGELGFPICKPLCRLAVLATDLDFSGEKNPNPYCAQIRSKGSHGVSAPTALRCPKKSSRCSLARFFRPLRVLRLAASATGGARLRTPVPLPRGGGGAVCPNSCSFNP